MIIDFEFGCSEETKYYYEAEDTKIGIETIGEVKIAEENYDIGVCGDLIEDDEKGKFLYHFCPSCKKEMDEFGAFPENIEEPVKSLKAKLESLEYSPLWLGDEIEVEYGVNISFVEGDPKSFFVHIGISVKCDTSKEILKKVIEGNFDNICLTEIDEDDCEFNIDCAKLFNSVDELTEKSLEVYEIEIDQIIDLLLKD